MNVLFVRDEYGHHACLVKQDTYRIASGYVSWNVSIEVLTPTQAAEFTKAAGPNGVLEFARGTREAKAWLAKYDV